jgi:GT2 family glycosyltransferase
MTNKDLTIIITTFKSESKIESCLNSIDTSIKVIIVENSNNKKFKEYIENKYSNVKCILASLNLGYGTANNLGLSNSTSKYSMILNPDTVLSKDAINNFSSFAKKNINFALAGPLQEKKEFALKHIPKNNNLEFIETDKIEGFAMFLNMEKFKKIGFFDENIFLYLEEIDLCKRVRNVGEKIFIIPDIKILHLGAKSVNQSFSYQIELTRNWHWMWSLFYYNKKHYNYFYALFLVAPNLLSASAKSIFYSFFLNKKKKEIYLKRLSGLINSIIGKPSWYRPTLD